MTNTQGGAIDFVVATKPGKPDYDHVVGIAATITLLPASFRYSPLPEYNITGAQPQPGNPWTYGTEPTQNGALSLFPAGNYASDWRPSRNGDRTLTTSAVAKETIVPVTASYSGVAKSVNLDVDR